MSLISTPTAAAHSSSLPSTSSSSPPSSTSPSPPLFNYILAVILVSLAWGFTTPFIRRGALSFHPSTHASLLSSSSSATAPTGGGNNNNNNNNNPLAFLRYHILKAACNVYDLLRTPQYAIPLVINLTGSVWFFLLVGNTELSLTVPVVNSLAFLCTTVGEWWVEGKGVGRDTWVGMGFVLGGIGLCVYSKSG